MKKLLLATTALVASAGIAAADVTLTGSAAAGFYSNLDDDGLDGVYSNAGIVATMSTTTDGGVTISASVDAEAGEEIDTGDFENDGPAGGTFALGAVSATGAFGTLTFDSDGIDNLYDDDRNGGDVSYSTTIGAISVAAVLNTDDSSETTTSTTDDMSVSASFTTGAMTISGAASSGDAAGTGTSLAVSYAVSDTVTISADTDNAPGAASLNTVGFATSINGISLSADASSDDTWDLDLGYTLSGVAITYGTTDTNAWDASASMDLGGGATVHAGVNHESSAYAGVSLSF
ncbi:porin [Amylibacter sp.]|nr:porin [Amylibacter sp.]MDC1455603.1 porin [Amylibacter sp.]